MVRVWRAIGVMLIGGVIVGGLVLACRPLPLVQGEALYHRYCATCHGLAGLGDGPVAESLTPKPADLTRLKEKYGGRYPLDEVMRAIDGRRTIRAHGTSAMPVWGEVFEAELQEAPHTKRTALLQVQAIAEYIRTLQRE
jgi:mono/diheme cytochrome c family protein